MQQFKDKNNILENIRNQKKVVIELGSGVSKKRGIGIDKLNLNNTDIIADIEDGLTFLDDNSVDEIYSNHLLEHINNFDLLLKEIHRILKNDGEFHCVVPHFSNPYHYSDPTHVRFFGYYSFYYYAEKISMDKIKRKVPFFYNNYKFEIVSQKIIFKSPFKVHKKILKIFETVINKNIFFQEFYERHLSNVITCSEIYSIMKVNK